MQPHRINCHYDCGNANWKEALTALLLEGREVDMLGCVLSEGEIAYCAALAETHGMALRPSQSTASVHFLLEREQLPSGDYSLVGPKTLRQFARSNEPRRENQTSRTLKKAEDAAVGCSRFEGVAPP